MLSWVIFSGCTYPDFLAAVQEEMTLHAFLRGLVPLRLLEHIRLLPFVMLRLHQVQSACVLCQQAGKCDGNTASSSERAECVQG